MARTVFPCLRCPSKHRLHPHTATCRIRRDPPARKRSSLRLGSRLRTRRRYSLTWRPVHLKSGGSRWLRQGQGQGQGQGQHLCTHEHTWCLRHCITLLQHLPHQFYVAGGFPPPLHFPPSLTPSTLSPTSPQSALKALREEHEKSQSALFEALSSREQETGSRQREVSCPPSLVPLVMSPAASPHLPTPSPTPLLPTPPGRDGC